MYEKLFIIKYFFLFVIELFKTKDINKAFSILVENSLKEIENDFETEKSKEVLINSFNFLNNGKKIYSTKEKKQAFKNTILSFDKSYTLTAIKFFIHIIKNDILILHKEVYIFRNLYTYLKTLFLHKEAIEKLAILETKDFNKRGIAKTKHPTVNGALKPRLAHNREAFKFNPIGSNKTQIKLYDAFKEAPLEIDLMYLTIKRFNIKLKAIHHEKEQTILNQRVFLNSATKLNDSHIFKSIQIYTMKISPFFNLPSKEYLKLTNSFLNSFFEEVYISKLTIHNFNQGSKIKSFFNDIPILTYSSNIFEKK